MGGRIRPSQNLKVNPKPETLWRLAAARTRKQQSKTSHLLEHPVSVSPTRLASLPRTSALPKTEAIHILIEKNPYPLTASFTIPDGTEPYVATRAKMGETTRVVAVVKADGKLYASAKETKVTLGGCGG